MAIGCKTMLVKMGCLYLQTIIKRKRIFKAMAMAAKVENVGSQTRRYGSTKIESRTKRTIKNGMVFANALHNTAGLIIQENDPSIHSDLVNLLERVAPLKGRYHHNYEGKENATAHLKSNLLGTFVTVPLKDREMVLGTWQHIFLVEFFEPRKREVVVTVIGE